MTVRLPMPEDWMRPLTLVFCCLGNIAERQDADVTLMAFDGPTHANPQGPREPSVAGTEDSCHVTSSSGVSGGLSKGSIAMVGAANAGVSKSKMKQPEEAADTAKNERFNRLMSTIEPTHADPQMKDMVRTLKSMADTCTTMSDACTRKARNDAIKHETLLLKELGDSVARGSRPANCASGVVAVSTQ